MPNLLQLDLNQYFEYFLILLRVSGIFFTAPILGDSSVPPSAKIGFSILISLIIFPLIPQGSQIYYNMAAWEYFLIIARELLLGILIGLIPKIIFAAIEFAGTLIGLQVGFAMANVIDPQSETQVSIIGSFKHALAILLFLVLNAHHLVIEVVIESFQVLPFGGARINPQLLDEIIRYSSNIFLIALKLSAPLTAIILLINIIMGFMARSIPQLNIFVVGFPLSIGIGLLVLALGMPFMIEAMSGIFDGMGNEIFRILRLLSI